MISLLFTPFAAEHGNQRVRRVDIAADNVVVSTAAGSGEYGCVDGAAGYVLCVCIACACACVCLFNYLSLRVIPFALV